MGERIRFLGFLFFFFLKLTTAIPPTVKILVTPRKEFTRERYQVEEGKRDLRGFLMPRDDDL